MTDVAEPGTTGTPAEGDRPVKRERAEWPPWARWGLILLALVAAGTFFWFATQRTVVGVDGPATDRAVVSQTPGPGDRALRQTEVGAELRTGYDGRISVNGQEIPEDQMEGAIDPNSRDAQKYGVRPNNRNKVFFKPGPGKAVSSFSGREVTISVRFWKEADGPAKARTITWQFAIT